MSTKLIGSLLAFLIVSAGGAGLYFGTDLFRPDVPVATERPIGGGSEQLTSSETGQPAAVEAHAASPEDEGRADSGEPLVMAPSFDILRVEPSGEIIAAGRAAPRAVVTMLADDEVFATDTANNDGEWAMVPAETLPAGEYDLFLRASGEDGRGGPVDGERVTVAIAGDGTTPLVAVTRPGEATRIMQRPAEREADIAAADDEISGDQVARGSPESPVALADLVDRSEPDPAADSADAADTIQAESVPVDAAQPAAREVVSSDEPTAAPDLGPAADGSGEPEATVIAELPPETAAETVAAAPSPPEEQAALRDDASAASGTDESMSPDVPASADRSDEVASTGQALPAREAEPSMVAIDAVEVAETEQFHVSGRADPDATIRLYLNEDHLGDARSDAAGSWSQSGAQALPPGRYTVRADLVDGNGDVTARAQVRFDRLRVAMAGEAPATPSGHDPASAQVEPRASNANDTAPSGGDGQGTIEAPEAAEASAPVPDSPVAAGVEGDFAASAREAVELSAVPARGDEPQASEPAVEPNTIFIERGDNLWRIARNIYGEGVRYSVIYEANRSQIRDPNLIYPGQVFTIPLPDEPGQ